MKLNFLKSIGLVAAIVALTIGVSSLAGATSSNSATAAAANGPTSGPTSELGKGQTKGEAAPPGAPGAEGTRGPRGGGCGPRNMTKVTGADAKKAKAAALNKVPGTALGVMKNADKDDYHVMVQKSDKSHVMVIVSSDFKSAEIHEGGPGRGGPPPQEGGPKPNEGTSVEPNSGPAPGATS